MSRRDDERRDEQCERSEERKRRTSEARKEKRTSEARKEKKRAKRGKKKRKERGQKTDAAFLGRDYITITRDYTLAAAKAFRKIPAADASKTETEPFRFVFVSGHGAATQPGMMTQFFGKVKGAVEVALADMTNAEPNPVPGSGLRPFLGSSVRPAGVDPHGHMALQPYVPPVPQLSLRLTRTLLAPMLRVTYPNIMSPTQPLGTFLARSAMGQYSADLVSEATKRAGDVEWYGGNKFAIVNNTAFRRIMKL